MSLSIIRNESQETATYGLNDRQLRAAELLSLGVAQCRVARALDVREATVSEWKRLPEFQAYLRDLRADARASFQEAQAGLCQLAVETLSEILVKGPVELRLRAALAIYGKGLDDHPAISGSSASAVGGAIVAALRAEARAHEH